MKMNKNNMKYQKMRLGWIPQDWQLRKLCNVSKIIFSNVDKKTLPNEQLVYLCNYMDVYYNDYIRANMQFMKASANQNEIKKFSLKKGDVIITKDSETQDDIAIPSVVIEDLKNVLCGYHLAIIRSNIKQLNGLFLMHLLNSTNINHQFVRLANGITRFGLNTSSVENALIPIPPIPEQKKIAKILSTWDDAIATIETLIAAKEKLKKGLMQQLLTGKKRFKEFEGNVKHKKTKLGMIPEDWYVREIKDTKIEVIDGDRGINYPKAEDFLEKGFCLFLSAKNVTKSGFNFSERKFISKTKEQTLGKGKIIRDDIVITTRGTVGNIAYFNKSVNFNHLRINSGMAVFRNLDKNYDAQFLYIFFNSNIFQSQIKKIAFGSAQPQLTIKEINKFKILDFSLSEQRKINSVLNACEDEIRSLKNKLKALQKQKKGLMQQLLTGKVRVTF